MPLNEASTCLEDKHRYSFDPQSNGWTPASAVRPPKRKGGLFKKAARISAGVAQTMPGIDEEEDIEPDAAPGDSMHE